MSNQRVVSALAIIGVVLAASPVLAQTKPAANEVAEAPNVPVEAALVVGALQIGSVANLEIAGIDIHVEKDSIV